MKRNVLIAGLSLVLLGTIALPAVGLPSLTSLDHREKRDYRSLNRRVGALSALALRGPVQHLVTENLTSIGRFWAGVADCPNGQVLTGGGVDWGSDDGVYGDWVINYSHPTASGHSWSVELFNGSSAAPATLPRAYAICLT